MVQKGELIESATLPPDLRKFGSGRKTAVHPSTDSIVGNNTHDGHDAIGVGERQRVQESSFQQCKERHVAADSESEHEHYQNRDTFVSSKERVAHGQIVAAAS